MSKTTITLEQLISLHDTLDQCERVLKVMQEKCDTLMVQNEDLRRAAEPLVDHYFNWAEINEPDFTCDHNAKLHSLYSDLNDALRQATKE